MFKKKLAVVLSALGLAASAMVVNVPQAAAEEGCSGSHVRSVNHYNSAGTLIAVSGAYWDGTYMCLVTVKKNSYYGKLTRIQQISNRKNLSTGNYTYKTNDETVYYWAGPLKVNGVNACINFEVDLWNANGVNVAQDYNYAPYCH
ncbi:MAG TPA: hypothetical protein VM677_20750 [Actinokineospora sp.]|jgi:hypothetical protein|nr:hypothetical protein [Actinokineospora sp.]